MKILIVSGIFPPDIGGPANYVPMIAKEFALHNHKINVITFSDLPYHKDDQLLKFKVIRILRRQNILMREIKFLIKGILLAKDSEIIYANGNNFKAYIISVISRRPIAHKIVGDTAWERAKNRNFTTLSIDDYQINKGDLKTRFLNWVRSYPLRKSDALITPSIYLSKIVSRWAPLKKVEVIYNSIEALPIVHSKVFPNKANTVIMLGRLVPWKGIDLAMFALREITHLNLMIIGDGPLKVELENLAKKLNISDRVSFMGHKNTSEVYELMKGAYCLLINSTYEGLPHVALEAFQIDLPVIATSVGGNPEVITNGKTGILIPVSDKKSLVKALLELSEMNREELCKNAKFKLEENFSFKKMIYETEALLERISLQ